MRRTLLNLSLALLLAGPALTAGAHQLRVAFSTIKLNPRTEQLEVVHRFFFHDAEHAVRQLADRPVDLIDNVQDQLAFGQYAVERFGLWLPDGTPVPLEYVGAEAEGDFIWVYQEAPRSEDPPGLVVENRMLHDVWADQVNTVNIEFTERLRTLEFRAGDDRKTARP